MKKILLFASAVAVMFSSCSTDNTSDVIGNEAKMGAISATVAYQQDGTRTEWDNTNRQVLWSKGDAIGVFNADGVQAQFGLTEGAGTANGKFEGNKNYLVVDEPAYAYYPYDKNTKLVDGVLDLEIAGNQTFLKLDSWDAAMAPAVGSTVVADKNDIKFKFDGVASYVTIPVKGVGTLNKLSLNIADQQLWGAGSVDFNDEVKVMELDANVENTTITVNCGGNIELDPFDAQRVLFVIPAGVDLHEKMITVTAELDGVVGSIAHSTTKTIADETKRATAVNTKVNLTYEGGAWSFGMEDAYLVYSDEENATSAFGDGLTAEERFLAYAYLTKPGQADITDYTNYIYAAEALKLENAESIAALKAQIFEESLDFAAYTKEWAQTQFNATAVALANDATDADAKFWQGVYAWYKGNEGAIESLAYNAVIGALESNVTIENLNVKGTGISAGASLKNLTFKSVAVATDAVVDAAGLIASFSSMTSTPNPQFAAAADMVIDNVVIAENNSINAPKAKYVGGIYGSYNKAVNLITTAKPIDIKAAGTMNTGRLFGAMAVGESLDFSNNKYEWHTSVSDYSAVGYFNSNATIVATGKVDASKKNMGVVAKVSVATGKVGSVVVDNVSYWNGAAEAVNPASPYYTAENFAYALANNVDIVLANDIDMQCVLDNFMAVEPYAAEATDPQYMTLEHTTSVNIDVTSAENEVFEVKNIVAVVNNARVSLFGAKSNISNVTLSNVTIYATKNEGVPIRTLAGIAATGTAENVTINGLTLNIASDAVLADDLSIGGVFGKVVNPLDVKDVTISALAINGPVENVDLRAGIIAGTLEVAPTTSPVVLEGIKLTGVDSDYVVGNFGEKYNASNNINAFKSSVNYAGAYPFGTIFVTNAAFPGNSQGMAYIGVDSAFKTWGNGNRLAAGVVFADDLTSAHKSGVKVKIGKPADGAKYDYALELTGGVIVGNKNTTNYFGFTKTKN